MLRIFPPRSLRKGDHPIREAGDEKTIPQAGAQGIPLVVGPNDDRGMARPPRGDSAQEMPMGMVHVENIELTLTKITGKVDQVTKMSEQKRRVIKLHGVIQAKAIRCLHAGLEDPSFNTILY